MNLRNTIGRVLTQGFRFWGGATSLSAFGPMEALVGVAMIALVRAPVDMVIYIGIPSFTALCAIILFWIFYILSLCLATAFLLWRFFPRSEFRQVLTMAICLFWLIPLVPLFSRSPWEKAWGLGLYATIPFFQWIPTFLVQRNYMPLGMVVVIPLIIVMVSRFMARTTGTGWRRALVLTLAAFVLIYTYYYQWIWQAWVIALFDKGLPPWPALLAALVTFSFLSQIITFLLTPVAAREFGASRVWKYMLWAGIPLLILLVLPQVGFFVVFLSASRSYPDLHLLGPLGGG